MRVLLIGATGNLGLRLIPALLTHGHEVVTFVRSSTKLESLLPVSIHRQITIVEGNAKDPGAIKRAILDTGCDAVVNTAGCAAVAPWAHTGLPEIFRSVLGGVQEASLERRQPLRVWFLGGQSVLNYPGSEDKQLASYIPIYLEHRHNYNLLKPIPATTLIWSMLCPNTMVAASSDFVVPTRTLQAKLVAGADSPPVWKDSWMKHIPFIGKMIVCGINAPRYLTTLEQNADFIAGDLADNQSQWSGKRVGVIDASR